MKVPEVLGVVGFLCLCLQSNLGEQIKYKREILHVAFSTYPFLILKYKHYSALPISEASRSFFFPFLVTPEMW